MTVNLEGGIGNQMFQYVAGLYIAIKLDCALVLNDSRVIANRHGGSCITDFVLPRVARISSGSNKPKFDNRITRNIRNRFDCGADRFKIFFETGPGFDAELEKLKIGRTISGYFQTREYVEYVRQRLEGFGTLELRQESSLFKKLKDRINLVDPVCLHVRRGDYYAHRDSFGILSSKYYESALGQVKAEYKDREVWVYSDQINQVKKEFDGIFQDRKLVFVDSSNALSPVEALKLMTLSSVHIVGNSSFSWWGAYFSKSSKQVIAPSPWFRNLRTSDTILPTDWTLCNSRWV